MEASRVQHNQILRIKAGPYLFNIAFLAVYCFFLRLFGLSYSKCRYSSLQVNEDSVCLDNKLPESYWYFVICHQLSPDWVTTAHRVKLSPGNQIPSGTDLRWWKTISPILVVSCYGIKLVTFPFDFFWASWSFVNWVREGRKGSKAKVLCYA